MGMIPEDQVRRLTRGEDFTCFSGSEAEHAVLSEFCMELQALLSATGQRLSDFTPDELSALISGLSKGEEGF